jgi:hypothetical protein
MEVQMAEDPKSESDRILARVERESAGGGLLATGFAATKAPATDNDDWIEHWGTRIGRTIGITAAAGLCAWIVLYALNFI